MRNIDIFEFHTYKEYLLGQENIRPRGFRALLAKAARCQASYISQILSGDGQLSPEQAENINELLGHNENEANYFLLLIHHQRAATPALRKRIASQLDRSRMDQSRLAQRLQLPTLSSEAQFIYYSSWKYAAVHVAASIPYLDSPEKIGRSLAISVSQVSAILSFLLKVGVLIDRNGKIILGQMRLHLEDNSLSIQQHHSNWRFKAMESLSRSSGADQERRLHYSSVVTLSTSDATAIRTALQESIATIKAKIAKSPEELVFGYNVDFFPLEN